SAAGVSATAGRLAGIYRAPGPSDRVEIDFGIARTGLEGADTADPRLDGRAVDIDDDEIVLGRHGPHLAASKVAEIRLALPPQKDPYAHNVSPTHCPWRPAP